MPMFDESHVKIEGCFVVWDGITQPESKPDGKGGNTTRWNLKVVIHPNNPDLALLNNIANQELQTSEFKGVLPNGGLMPIGTARQEEFNGLYTGWAVVNASTFKNPQVYDENGAILDPMAYGNMLYGGQQVDIVVHCKHYNNQSKGIAARLDGFAIIASAQAQRQMFGGGGIDCSGAFGGGQPQQQPAQGQPQQQNFQQPQQFNQNQQQPAQGQQQQQNFQQPQQFNQNQQQPAQGQPQPQNFQQPQQFNQNQQQPAQGQDQNQQQPQQAHNFLPQ